MNGMQFGPEIYSSQKSEDLPFVEIGPFKDEVFASYTGPDCGLTYDLDNKERGHNGEIAGVQKWNVKEERAYGICLSLYEQHPVSGKMSGDPVADAFAICARTNNCIMLIADGVNWGEKSRLAARSALYGSMNFINNRLFSRLNRPHTTHDIFDILRASFDAAHRVILEREGGLTTLCGCIVVPVSKSSQFAVCCLNVGDSYGFIYSHNQGIREVTQGSHNVSLVRDIRDAGGALGPVDGQNPELHNLTFGISFANPGDIVFLTTDGISDNYDPVVTKIAVARFNNSECEDSDVVTDAEQSESEAEASSAVDNSGKPDMEPKERHIYALKEMERIIHEHELITEEQCSAQDFCSAIVQHVLLLTDTKRKVLENPELYTKKRLSQKDKKKRDSEIVSKMSESPGKLDHASIVAYEVGMIKPNESEMDCIPLEGTLYDNVCPLSPSLQTKSNSSSDSITSPSSHSKRIRPKKFFNKLRNNLNLGSAPNSPTSESSSAFPASPKRFSFKRSKSKGEQGPMSPTSPSADASGSPYEAFRYPKSPNSPGHFKSPSSPTDPFLAPLASPTNGNRAPIAFESSV